MLLCLHYSAPYRSTSVHRCRPSSACPTVLASAVHLLPSAVVVGPPVSSATRPPNFTCGPSVIRQSQPVIRPPRFTDPCGASGLLTDAAALLLCSWLMLCRCCATAVLLSSVPLLSLLLLLLLLFPRTPLLSCDCVVFSKIWIIFVRVCFLW